MVPLVMYNSMLYLLKNKYYCISNAEIRQLASHFICISSTQKIRLAHTKTIIY